jgi:hypothetical protein
MSNKGQAKDGVRDSGPSEKKLKFTEPKLKFIEPKLIKQGDATKITGSPGFFGTFVP